MMLSEAVLWTAFAVFVNEVSDQTDRWLMTIAVVFAWALI